MLIGQRRAVDWVKLDEIPPEKVIIMDTETTGLDGQAEVLEVAICNAAGETLFHELIKPTNVLSWDGAQAVHHIGPEDVANKEPLSFYFSELDKIFTNAKILIGYNISFDVRIIEQSGYCFDERIPEHKLGVLDIMPIFSDIYGEWNDYYGNFKWQKLTTAADYYDYNWADEAAHGALADTHATLFVYEKIKNMKRGGK